MEIKKVTRIQINNIDDCFVVDYASGACRKYQKMPKSIEKFINNNKVLYTTDVTMLNQFGQRKHKTYAIYINRKQFK